MLLLKLVAQFKCNDAFGLCLVTASVESPPIFAQRADRKPESHT